MTIEKPVYRGQGLARHEGQVVFVARAVPGDRIRARVQSVSSGYVRAVPEVLLEPGPHRREAPCSHAETCGGCTYQGYEYGAQLRLKEAVLRDALARAGTPYAGEIVAHESPEVGWRTRAQLHLELRGAGKLSVGFHQEGTHRVVPLSRCLQISEPMNRSALALAEAIAADPRFLTRVQGITLAESFAGEALVAVLETDLDPAGASALARLQGAVPWLSGLGAVEGSGRARRYLPLAGDPHVEAHIQELVFRTHVQSFFQGNRFLTESLVASVGRAMAPGRAVLDLYAGAGLFGLSLARQASQVTAVEGNPFGVEDGRANAARAGLENVRYHEGDVAEALGRLPRERDELVILDPPRAGAGPDVVARLLTRRPANLVYVSCDPATLGRDLKTLVAGGYSLQSVDIFDLFPDTFHLETVAVLGL